MQQVMISVCHFSFGFLHSMVIADIFCPSVMCPKPLKIKKIINKINRNQNQQIAAKKKNVSTGITGVFWGTKLKHHLKGQIFTGESGSCMQLVTAFCIAMGFGGKKNKNITHHQGEMYIVIQEQNDLK